MVYSSSIQPSLIDATTGYYLYNTLQHCHENRVKAYSFIFNAIVIVLFFTLGGFILYLCFQKKKNPSEKHQQMIEDQKLILNKIRALKEQPQNYYSETFTHLPLTQPDLSNEGV